MLGDVVTYTNFFFIKPEGNPDYILFWISTQGSNLSFDSLVNAFVAAFGKPASTTTETIRSRLAAPLENKILRWDNPVSYFEIRHYGSSVDEFELHHYLKPLQQILADRLKLIGANKAKKL